MGWFTKKALATNAPSSWPRIPAYSRALPPDVHGRLDAEAHVLERLHDTARSGSPFHSVQLNATVMTDAGGVIWAPMGVVEGSVQRFLYVYPVVNDVAADHFESHAAFLKQQGYPSPVYYAPEALPRGRLQGALTVFDPPTHLTRVPPDTTDRCGWWKTPDEADFASSVVAEAVGRANRACEGIHSYVLAALLRAGARLTPENVRLPLQPVTLDYVGPEGKRLAFTASPDKGFRWHFDPETIPTNYRDRFWMLWAEYCERFRSFADKDHWPRDPETDPTPLREWELLLKTVRNKVGGFEMDRFAALHTLPPLKASPRGDRPPLQNNARSPRCAMPASSFAGRAAAHIHLA